MTRQRMFTFFQYFTQTMLLLLAICSYFTNVRAVDAMDQYGIVYEGLSWLPHPNGMAFGVAFLMFFVAGGIYDIKKLRQSFLEGRQLAFCLCNFLFLLAIAVSGAILLNINLFYHRAIGLA